MSVLSPNMNLVIPVIGVDSGLVWEQAVNANSSILDGHNHSAGSGVPINSTGINISSDLLFNGQNATILRSTRYQSQSAPLSGASDLDCLYFSNGNLFCNDGSANQVQITSGGLVNATSSGISNGTATASFVSNVLVVNAASNTPANIQGGSLLLGNNVSGSKFLTLSPPAAMAANYSLTLPTIPGITSIMALDTSGNISAPYTVDNTTIAISANQFQVKDGGITAQKLAPLGQQIGSAINTTYSGNSLSGDLGTVSITTTGRPVFVGVTPSNISGVSFLQAADTTVNTCTSEFHLLRDGVTISVQDIGITVSSSTGISMRSFPTSISVVDTGATAAAHVYSIRVVGAAATAQTALQNVALIAYEIG